VRLVQFVNQIIQMQTQLAFLTNRLSERITQEIVNEHRSLDNALEDGIHVASVADVLVTNDLSLFKILSIVLTYFLLWRLPQLFLFRRKSLLIHIRMALLHLFRRTSQ